MVDQGIAMGVHAGVYANWNGWSQIVGREWSYPAGKGLPVWYAHYDSKQTFADFQPFGGWTKPAMKREWIDREAAAQLVLRRV